MDLPLQWTWWIVVLHAAATGMMIGIIWFVQVVHYPLMALVGRDGYPAYQAAHSRRTTFVVMPPMLVESATGIWQAPAGTHLNGCFSNTL
jgi:hypothetical protein